MRPSSVPLRLRPVPDPPAFELPNPSPPRESDNFDEERVISVDGGGKSIVCWWIDEVETEYGIEVVEVSFVRTLELVEAVGEGVIVEADIVVTRCVLSVLDLGRFDGAGIVELVEGGLGEREEDAVGFAAIFASCTQFAIDRRAVARSTARLACARSPFEPTT